MNPAYSPLGLEELEAMAKERPEDKFLKGTGVTKLIEEIHRLRSLCEKLRAPDAYCATCSGSGFVDDGELTHSAGGVRYENGPVKCIKDCPACKPQRRHT